MNVAQIVLEMTLERNQPDESGIDNGNGENLTLNEAKIQRLNQLVDEALRINPLNVDPLVKLICIYKFYLRYVNLDISCFYFPKN